MNDSERLLLREAGGATRMTVRVIPRAGRTEPDGVTEDGALRMRLTAPPVDGAANAALIAFLADLFGLPKRDVTIVRGCRAEKRSSRSVRRQRSSERGCRRQ